MKNKKNVIIIVVVVAILALALAWPKISSMTASQTSKWPERDITVLVPWSPGGSTDLSVRAAVDEMSKILKVNMPVVNSPGASGSAGTLNVWNGKHDGYTILGNTMNLMLSYPVNGYMKQTFRDWNTWLITSTPNIIVVKPDSKYKDIKVLIEDMKKNPNAIKVATTGVGSSGQIGMERLKSIVDFSYKHVTYTGGAPVSVATLSGEVDVASMLVSDCIDMLKAKKLVAIGCFLPEAFDLGDGIKIPSITQAMPEFKGIVPLGTTLGLSVPKDTPQDIVKKIDESFKTAVKSQQLKKFAEEKGFTVMGLAGKEAEDFLTKMESVIAWTLFETGAAKVSPQEFKIPRPTK